MSTLHRAGARAFDALRDCQIEIGHLPQAEGSALITIGNTKVSCTASVLNSVPPFLRGRDQGWLTAEYGMLPRATQDRTAREAVKGKQSGRTQEIQRLIGRALRACVNLKALGESTITIDCDVLSADGGTRTAAITGACVALVMALKWMGNKKSLKGDPLNNLVAAISVGIVDDEILLDLDYQEDSRAQTDMNIVMDETGGMIELQGTAEKQNFSRAQLDGMVEVGTQGIMHLLALQKAALSQLL